MDLTLRITPVGDTTSHEVSAAAQEVRDILERLPDVTSIAPQRIPAPDQLKGVFVDVLGSFVLSVPPAILTTVLQALKTVLERQPAATKILIETKDGKFSFEFDPKRISLKELIDAAARLRAAAPS